MRGTEGKDGPLKGLKGTLGAVLFIDALSGAVFFLEWKDLSLVAKMLLALDAFWFLAVLPLHAFLRWVIPRLDKVGWFAVMAYYYLYWAGMVLFLTGAWDIPRGFLPWDRAEGVLAVLSLVGAFYFWMALEGAPCPRCGKPFLDQGSTHIFILPWEFKRCRSCGGSWTSTPPSRPS